MTRRKHQIQWRQIKSDSKDVMIAMRDGIAAEAAVLPKALTDSYDLILRAGEFPSANAPDGRVEALRLLAIAAEVEHALLVQYLYSAYSLTHFATRRAIAHIAKQEMGHLITVENLILSLGGEPYFGRQDQSPNPGHDPIPFLLEPFSKVSLAKYIEAEMPELDALSEEERDEVARIAKEAKKAAMQPLGRVGALYAAILLLFEPPSEQPPELAAVRTPMYVRDEDFRPASELEDIQATATEWGAASTEDLFIDTVTSRQQAIDALVKIMVQGEGPGASAGGESNHFRQFLRLYQIFDTIPAAKRVPTLPNTSATPQSEPTREAGRIRNESSRRIALLSNTRYSILILLLNQSLRLTKQNQYRARLIFWALEEMKMVFGPLALALAGLDQNPTPDGNKAGIPFEIDAEETPATLDAFWRRLVSLLEESESSEAAIFADTNIKETVRTSVRNAVLERTATQRQYIRDNAGL